MTAASAASRYREYLRTFGIAEPRDRVVEQSALDVGEVRFFAYSSDDGVRLKAAVTPCGLVVPAGQATDDWHGFLLGVPNADVAAERIAWLETDESRDPHGLPQSSVKALGPNVRYPSGIDPAQWALVTAPASDISPDNGVTLTAWFLAEGVQLTRWTIVARPRAMAVIERISAQDLLIMRMGSAQAVEADATRRAREIVACGPDAQRLWALQHTSDVGDAAALPEVAALLASTTASVDSRMHAAAVLGRLGDPAALSALGNALRSDAASEVRRASAQAISRLGGSGAEQALACAIPGEPDTIVRAEIVHALAAQGPAATGSLAEIARTDPEAMIRELARGSVAARKKEA